MSTFLKLNTHKYGISSLFQKKLSSLYSVLNDLSNVVYIFHDNDSDGLCSYLQLKNSFKSIKGGHFITKEEEVQKIALQKIRPKTTHIIFLDTPNIEETIINQILDLDIEIIILDHHSIDKKVLNQYQKQKKITYINPLLYNSLDSRPITYFSYLLSEKSFKNLEFALIGSVADFYITPLFLDVFEDKNTQISILFQNIKKPLIEEIVTNLKNNSNYYAENKVENAQIIQMLSYSTPIGTCKQFFFFFFKNTLQSHEHTKLIQSFNSINELLAEINAAQYPPFSDFEKYSSKYKKILQKAYSKFDSIDNSTNNSNKEQILIIEHRGKTSYNRQLSEQALYEKSISISCSLHQKYERAFISGSIRSVPSINLYEILKEVFNKKNSIKWGGHPQACGFQFPEEFREEFNIMKP